MGVVFGGLLMALAALVLGSYGSLGELRLAGEEVFPSAFEEAGFEGGLEELPLGTGLRESVDIEIAGGINVEVTIDGASHDLLAAVAEGEFREVPDRFASRYVTRILLEGGPPSAGLVYGPPTVEMTDDGGQRIILSGSVVDLPTRPEAIFLAPLCTFEECTTHLEVHSESIDLVGLSPTVDVVRREARLIELEVTSDSELFQGLTIYLAPRRAEAGATVAPRRTGLPSTVTNWWNGLARSIWPLALWFLLWGFLDTRTPPQTPGSRPATVARLLVRLGLITAVVSSLLPFNSLIRSIVGTDRLYESAGSTVQMFADRLSGTSVPAAAGLYAVWALAARPRRAAQLVAGGAGVVLLLASVAAVWWGTPDEDLHAIMNDSQGHWILLSATAACLVGAAVVSRSMGIGMGGTLAPACFAGGVVVVASLLYATYSERSQWAAGFLALVIDTLVLAAVLMLLVQALGFSRLNGRRRRLLTGAVVAASAAIAMPSYHFATNVSPLSMYDVLSINGLLVTLVPLGLTIAAAVLLPAALSVPDSRWILIGLTGVLLLRPEIQYAGIPWSFLAGLGLIAIFLLSSAESVQTAVGPRADVIADRVRRLVTVASRTRTERELSNALRRKVAVAELTESDAETIARQVQRGFATPSSASSQDPAVSALSWSRWPHATARAVRGLVLASIVGIVLSFSNAISSFGDIDGGFGTRTVFPVIDLIGSFKYPWYGFAFGCLLPLIPGRSGLAKAARLFMVVSASEVLVLVIPADDAQLGQALALRLLQLALLFAVLGVAADLAALRGAGLSVANLGDLYATNRLVIWSSGIAGAVAVATATALLGSAASLLIERIVPPEPPPPPPDQTQQAP